MWSYCISFEVVGWSLTVILFDGPDGPRYCEGAPLKLRKQAGSNLCWLELAQILSWGVCDTSTIIWTGVKSIRARTRAREKQCAGITGDYSTFFDYMCPQRGFLGIFPIFFYSAHWGISNFFTSRSKLWPAWWQSVMFPSLCSKLTSQPY